MINEKKEPRIIIGIGGGHREYKMNDVTYVVDGRFAKPTCSDKDKTLADKIEKYVGSEFADLTLDEENGKIEPKPVRSTAEKQAKKNRGAR